MLVSQSMVGGYAPFLRRIVVGCAVGDIAGKLPHSTNQGSKFMKQKQLDSGSYLSLHRGAALHVLTSRSLLVVHGKDRARFLHNMLTNDIASLRPGEGCSAVKVSVQGKMEAALRVICLEEEMWCDLDGQAVEVVLTGLRRRIVLEEAELQEASRRWKLLSLQGPAAADVLRKLGGRPEALPQRHQHAAAMIGGIDGRIVRSDHTGEGGFDFWIPHTALEQMTTLLVEAGARLVDAETFEVRRVEAGIPRHGAEITADYFPQEAGLDAGWISYTKGCYLGQETIARIHHMGHVNRCLRGLLFEKGDAPAAGDTVRAGDKAIGVVTSAVDSLGLGRPIALAYVRRENGMSGTPVTVSAGGGASPSGGAPSVEKRPQGVSHSPGMAARVTTLPFL